MDVAVQKVILHRRQSRESCTTTKCLLVTVHSPMICQPPRHVCKLIVLTCVSLMSHARGPSRWEKAADPTQVLLTTLHVPRCYASAVWPDGVHIMHIPWLNNVCIVGLILYRILIVHQLEVMHMTYAASLRCVTQNIHTLPYSNSVLIVVLVYETVEKPGGGNMWTDDVAGAVKSTGLPFKSPSPSQGVPAVVAAGNDTYDNSEANTVVCEEVSVWDNPIAPPEALYAEVDDVVADNLPPVPGAPRFHPQRASLTDMAATAMHAFLLRLALPESCAVLAEEAGIDEPDDFAMFTEDELVTNHGFKVGHVRKILRALANGE
eukprot:m.786973 g.786973  ORF g.786973 m.786973 type:complete len:320 (-) comp23306_c0_seq24:1066-2025(-)